MAKLSVFQSAIHTPQDISRLEKQTGMKAVISGHGIKLVDFAKANSVAEGDPMEAEGRNES